MPLPLLPLAIIGSGIAQGVGSYLSGQQQIEAAQQAQSSLSSEARKNRRLQQQMLAIMRQLMEEGLPLREAQRQAGILATERLSDSSVFGKGAGELTGQLTAEDANRIAAINQFLAGNAPRIEQLAPSFGQLGAGFGGQAGALTGQAANLQSQIGGVRAGTTGAISSIIGNLPQQFQQFQLQSQLQDLLKGFNPGGGSNTLRSPTAFV
jgi:hypothetical protein